MHQLALDREERIFTCSAASRTQGREGFSDRSSCFLCSSATLPRCRSSARTETVPHVNKQQFSTHLRCFTSLGFLIFPAEFEFRAMKLFC